MLRWAGRARPSGLSGRRTQRSQPRMGVSGCVAEEHSDCLPHPVVPGADLSGAQTATDADKAKGRGAPASRQPELSRTAGFEGSR